MDCFKLKPGAGRIFPITQKEYLRRTRKETPYCIQDEKGGNHFYAVCPECDNPIQIVGLFQDTAEAGRKPYGRHHNVRCGDITFNAAGIVLLKAIYNILTINVKAAVFIGVHIDAEEWFKDENGNAYNEDVVGWGEFIANLNY